MSGSMSTTNRLGRLARLPVLGRLYKTLLAAPEMPDPVDDPGALQLLDGASTEAVVEKALAADRHRLKARLSQSQRMETLGRLTCSVTHDFQNVLTVILGYSDMLLESLGDDPMRTTLVHEIQKAVENGAALTSQLLTYSRKQSIAPRPLDLTGIVVNMAPILRRLLGKRITVVAPECSAAFVCADPVQMEQVLLNLAVNARDAMPQGGRLTITTLTVEVAGESAVAYGKPRAGCYVALCVTDTGLGMDGDVRTHIFEPFFTTKEPGKGTGLGLAIVADIVHQAGGFIEVQSSPGQGTLFRVCIPQAENSRHHAAHRATDSALAS
jgi:signal transduction histidine kinase